MPDPLPFPWWPLVGVVHLLPLPGSPQWAGNLQDVRDSALWDAEAYVKGGMTGLIVENYGDRPFAPACAPPATVAAMTAMALGIKEAFPDLVLGINVLRNDVASALAIATTVDAGFVRVNVLVGAMVADQGIIQGQAWEIAHLRRQLGTGTRLWADVMVKHAAPLGSQTLEDQASDAFLRAGADVLVLSGRATGSPANPEDFRRVRRAVPKAPLVIGSGLTRESLNAFRAVADGAIVASTLKGKDGRVEIERVRDLVGDL